MKEYLNPEINILRFSHSDVMADSSISSGSGGSQYVPMPSPGGSMWYPPRP